MKGILKTLKPGERMLTRYRPGRLFGRAPVPFGVNSGDLGGESFGDFTPGLSSGRTAGTQ